MTGSPDDFSAGVRQLRMKRRDQRRAWASTVHALKGVALSVGVELTGALLATVVWVVGVFAG